MKADKLIGLLARNEGPPAAISYRQFMPEISPPMEVHRGLEQAHNGELVDRYPPADVPDDRWGTVESEPCPGRFYHGPGHQSSTRCELEKDHEGSHRCIYGSHCSEALWNTGDYTGRMRKSGIEFSAESYPEDIGMSGYHDEPPQFQND